MSSVWNSPLHVLKQILGQVFWLEAHFEFLSIELMASVYFLYFLFPYMTITHIQAYINTLIYTYLHTYIYKYFIYYIYIHIHIYIYIYIYTYIHTYIYIFICCMYRFKYLYKCLEFNKTRILWPGIMGLY